MIYDASTVIVLRDSAEGPEVFMVRRHGKSSFMANAWVYPGGKLDAADTRPEVRARVVGTTRWKDGDDLRAVGLTLAAIRETFEEAGLLLARRAGEDDWVDLESAPNFVEHRVALQKGDTSLSAVAEREDLVFPVDDLFPYAHWITPTFEPRRFDTAFFVTRAPAHQEALHDDRETTDSFWIRPADVLSQFGAGVLYLAPPTERTLSRLSLCRSVDEVFASVADFTPPVIIPHLDNSSGTPVLLLPGDPDYPADDPEYARATPVDGETRMRLVMPGAA